MLGEGIHGGLLLQLGGKMRLVGRLFFHGFFGLRLAAQKRWRTHGRDHVIPKKMSSLVDNHQFCFYRGGIDRGVRLRSCIDFFASSDRRIVERFAGCLLPPKGEDTSAWRLASQRSLSRSAQRWQAFVRMLEEHEARSAYYWFPRSSSPVRPAVVILSLHFSHTN